jgi:uncharacterized repeat protein (TIGR03803 family)
MTRLSECVTRLLCCAALCAGIPAGASAAKTRIIYSFTGGADGATPLSPLTPDSSGNVYGTTQGGGNINTASCPFPDGCGTIFKLDGAGKLTTLHAFAGGAAGQFPGDDVGLALIGGVLYGNVPESGGNDTSAFFSINTDGSGYKFLYGMTLAQGGGLIGVLQPVPGGAAFGIGGPEGGKFGRGTLFYLAAGAGLTVVHEFAGGADGDRPTYLIQDSHHNLFGSTYSGGQCAALKRGCGTIFEYIPSTGTYTVLYAFQDGADGYVPLIGAAGPDGTLYGVTQDGGAGNHGALFALTPSGARYSFSVLSAVKYVRPGDGVNNPPALSPTGALVGGTGGGGTYVYQNGRYVLSYNNTVSPSPDGQFLIPRSRPDAILATSEQYGTPSTCNLPVAGCGFIYSQQQ